MKPFSIPVVALGPGSQSEDQDLNYMTMPSGMQTFRPPVLPEPEAIQSSRAARQVLGRLLTALDNHIDGDVAQPIDLSKLPVTDLTLLNQVLGEGEVSAQVTHETDRTMIQESVFAGVWRVRRQTPDHNTFDRIEVTGMPTAVRQHAGGTPPAPAPAEPGPGLASAPALLTEILDRACRPEQHVINLSLLPYTPDDGDYLDRTLGRGSVSILSRGYGNCRISSTGVERVWWVQFFNSQDVLILNTIEIADVPEVALAADEDIVDSRERLAEVLDWLG